MTIAEGDEEVPKTFDDHPQQLKNGEGDEESPVAAKPSDDQSPETPPAEIGNDGLSETANPRQDGEGEEQPLQQHKSLFTNTMIHPFVRNGILLLLIVTIALLLAADVGSGVTVSSIMIEDGEIVDENTILNVSVLSSVGKLWEAESYPLAIFIAITSIGWPYIKLGLATYAWVTPYNRPRRREVLIEIIDALGKWSFVDIMVLVEIMVAFRSTVPIGPDLSLEIVLVAQWGFYGFVMATMLSLLSTHLILHYHREVHYHKAANSVVVAETGNDDSGEKRGMKEVGNLSTRFILSAIGALVASMIFYLAGVLTETFEVTSTRGTNVVSNSYSIRSIGMAIPGAYIDRGHLGTRFIQAMWFFLGVAMPLWCSVLFVVLYALPRLSKRWMRIIFTLAEIAFAWSCAEVLFLSTIFAVQQMPIFGDGLVENNCAACFVITTKILPEFSVLCIGTILNVGANVWLYRKSHNILYHDQA
mmetsp:Transcript_1563/g.3786  ORF Transcript_1563/g.3786 Transcript_1563/m.3786 type:complete len:474 (-) Transcript_1563:371-1792(-)|eukprot:CAMPEP_0201125884 /NCGR_PEP_ID=MMETSP0850-20130426/23574_1 /ASSEMBLY_ACC=CAM_ASM_000622 /TAXON_ID=183588 /ORGANISM="Pseudo-nitzschia fraudulenta, Strain WWA7" /LENGTH=473 /DNA_ID=CAMNT_0047394075 /DNA_START=244 /DNA_END=1665 /DNA_ORIENTATION=+